MVQIAGFWWDETAYLVTAWVGSAFGTRSRRAIRCARIRCASIWSGASSRGRQWTRISESRRRSGHAVFGHLAAYSAGQLTKHAARAGSATYVLPSRGSFNPIGREKRAAKAFIRVAPDSPSGAQIFPDHEQFRVRQAIVFSCLCEKDAR